jgi:NTE family protein
MTDSSGPWAAGATAFVFCGGAGLGAMQVGMLRALVERGIRPDFVTGTSSGSLNALVYAADPSLAAVDRLERLWLSARRRDLFRMRPSAVGRGLFGSSPSLASNASLRRLLESTLPVRFLEDTTIPVAIALTDAQARKPTIVSSGNAIDVLMATSAIPGLFPPVEIDGREYMDGGLVADPPIGAAVELGATHAYVFPVGWPIVEPVAGNAAARAADAVDWLCWRIAEFELERWSAHCRIHLLPSPSTRRIAPFDLRATRRLIDEAYALTTDWLERSDATAFDASGRPSRPPAASPARGWRRVPNLVRRGHQAIARIRGY